MEFSYQRLQQIIYPGDRKIWGNRRSLMFLRAKLLAVLVLTIWFNGSALAGDVNQSFLRHFLLTNEDAFVIGLAIWAGGSIMHGMAKKFDGLYSLTAEQGKSLAEKVDITVCEKYRGDKRKKVKGVGK